MDGACQRGNVLIKSKQVQAGIRIPFSAWDYGGKRPSFRILKLKDADKTAQHVQQLVHKHDNHFHTEHRINTANYFQMPNGVSSMSPRKLLSPTSESLSLSNTSPTHFPPQHFFLSSEHLLPFLFNKQTKPKPQTKQNYFQNQLYQT